MPIQSLLTTLKEPDVLFVAVDRARPDQNPVASQYLVHHPAAAVLEAGKAYMLPYNDNDAPDFSWVISTHDVLRYAAPSGSHSPTHSFPLPPYPMGSYDLLVAEGLVCHNANHNQQPDGYVAWGDKEGNIPPFQVRDRDTGRRKVYASRGLHGVWISQSELPDDPRNLESRVVLIFCGLTNQGAHGAELLMNAQTHTEAVPADALPRLHPYAAGQAKWSVPFARALEAYQEHCQPALAPVVQQQG